MWNRKLPKKAFVFKATTNVQSVICLQIDVETRIALHEAFLEWAFEQVSLTFFVSGHSQNENDTAHSNIESNCQKKHIYTTNQWETVIECAFKNNNVCVTPIAYKDVIDLKNKKAFPQYSYVTEDKVEDNVVDESNKKVY